MADWQDVFVPNAMPAVMSHVSVVILNQYTLEDTSDSLLVERFHALQGRNIKILLPVQSIAAPGTCGSSEGFEPPEAAAKLIGKLQRLGLKVDLIRLDEPVWFGMYDDAGYPASKLPPCHFSSRVLAAQVHRNIQQYMAAFPSATLGEVEPVPVATGRPGFLAAYKEWKTEFEALSHHRIDFLDAEVHTLDPNWADQLKQTHSLAKTLGMKFGIIYNSSGPDLTDQDWVGHAIQLFEFSESALKIIPDHAVFQSWASRPARLGPETLDSTLGYAVATYLLPRTTIDARRVPSGVAGTVMTLTSEKYPVTDARLSVATSGAPESGVLPTRSASGVVPPAARFAILALRINMECNCSAPTDVSIGELSFREMTGGSVVKSDTIQPPHDRARQKDISFNVERVGSTTITHLKTSAAGQYLYNSTRFAVTPGAQFLFTVPIRNAAGMGLPGYAAIIWLDADGRGFSRTLLHAPEQYTEVGTAIANAKGEFLAKLPSMMSEKQPLRVELERTAQFRGAFAVVP